MCRRRLLRLLPALLIPLVPLVAAAVPDGREDPTRPERWRAATATRVASDVPTLSSVLIGGGRKLAVLNGRVMSEGEKNNELKLWKVEADRVVVGLADGRRVTVRLDKAAMTKANSRKAR